MPAAQQIIENILSRIKQIETFPESGANQEIKNAGTDYRYLVEGNYKIIYSYNHSKQVAYIASIFDTRHNPEKLRV